MNNLIPIIFFVSLLFVPVHPCSSYADSSPTPAKKIILYEDWEKNNFKNWDHDFRKGDTTIESDPVHGGSYAVRQRASDPGSLINVFGDHPGVNNKAVDDVTLESYLYFPPGFQWSNDGITLWTLACFEDWNAGYSTAKGSSNPLTWSPYYIMIALKGDNTPVALLTRADGLGGAGELYREYGQNIGETTPIQSGKWTRLKFRARLNEPGKHDGILQIWLNDDLRCNYSNINFRGTYQKYGWNHLMMSFVGSPSQADTQWISRDDILLSAGEAGTSAVPMVRKKIVRKPLSSESLAEAEQPKPVEPKQERQRPRAPTGLSVVQPGATRQRADIPSLPEGNSGIASKYPGDKGIEKDPNVIFVEKFDSGPDYEIMNPIALQLIFSRWDAVKLKEGMSLSTDVPEGSADRRSLLVTHEHGQDSWYLYRQLLPGYDKVFVRYYVKFAPDCALLGHFGAWIGGYNPPTAWPQGGAGARPTGFDRFTTGVEPFGSDWAWDFYTYWQGMHAHGDGKYWGTPFLVYGPKPPVEKGRWICVETMVQMNDPVASSNGSQAFWIDGKLFRRDGQIVSYFGPGFPKGGWTGGWWKPDSHSGSAFEGFQWRSTKDLVVNFLWLQAYQPKTPQGGTSRIWFDNIVVASKYIGPISSP